MALAEDLLKLIEKYDREARCVELTKQSWQVAPYPEDDLRHSAETYRAVIEDLSRLMARYYTEQKLDPVDLSWKMKAAIKRETSRAFWNRLFTHERPQTIPEA